MGMYKIWASYKPKGDELTYVGDHGELFYSENDPRLRISDGVTPGGIILSTGGGGGTVDLTQITSNVSPATSATYDLGGTNSAWRDLYLAANGTFYIGTESIYVDQTTGQLILPVGTQVRQTDGSLNPAGVDLADVDLYLEDLLNIDTSNGVDGSLLQLQRNGNNQQTWTATNVLTTPDGDLFITGGTY